MKTYEQLTQEIQGLRKTSAQDVYTLGKLLVDVRQKIKHDPDTPYKNFTEYLSREFPDWARQHIYRFIKVFEVFRNYVGTCDNLEIDEIFKQFDPSALYLLAEKKTPIASRQEAIDRAKYGERITRTIAKGIQQAHGVTTQRNYQYKITEPMDANDAQRYLEKLTKEIRFCEKQAAFYKEQADLLQTSQTQRKMYEDLRTRQKEFEGRSQGIRYAIENFLASGVTTVKPLVVEGLPDVNACEIESKEEKTLAYA